MSEQRCLRQKKSINPAKPCDFWDTKNSIEKAPTTSKNAGLRYFIFYCDRNPAWTESRSSL